MTNKKTILFLHGMGGSPECSLTRALSSEYNVVSRLYDFDPEIAQKQILSWVEECKPDLVVAISLGAFHSLAIHGIPHILISPAFDAAKGFDAFAGLDPFTRMMAGAQLGKTEPGHQKINPDLRVIRKFRPLSDRLMEYYKDHEADRVWGFYGQDDSYMGMGVVNPGRWKEIFGNEDFTVLPMDHNCNGVDIVPLVISKARELIKT